MRELREYTFSGNKNEDAHEHVEGVLDILSLFNIPGVTHDAVMLHVFPITLTRAAKRWVNRLSPRTVDSLDLLKKAFIQRYCPPSKTAKQLEDIRNFKQDGSSSRNIDRSSNYEGIAAIVSKLYAIQVGCQFCERAHLDKECPLNEEVKSAEEVKYEEFGRPSPFSNGAKYSVGLPGYYTRLDNRLPIGEKRLSLKELMNKHFEESTGRRAEMEEWVQKLQENTKIITRNQSAFLKNLEIQIEQLIKEFHAKTASEATTTSNGLSRLFNEAPLNSSTNEPHEVSFIFDNDIQVAQKECMPSSVLPCQLPLKELNPGSFTLPYTIRSLNFYAMADLGASVNVIPKSLFEHLKLANLKKTNILIEMADMTKRAPIRIVENALVTIDKFLFPSEFVVIEMLNIRNETMILGRPFLATIHAKIDVFNKEISLGIKDDMITFDMDKKFHNFTTSVGKVCMVNSIHNEEPSTSSNEPLDMSLQFKKSSNLYRENDNHMQERNNKKAKMIETNKNAPSTHFFNPIKQIRDGALKHKGGGLSFPEFLLVSYGEVQGNDFIWDNRYVEWCNENSSLDTPTLNFTSVQEDCKPRPKDYPFKDWLLTKVGHTDINEPVKKALLKTWLIDCFQEELVKDPRSRSFNDYKWMFDFEIDQLADEYELGIGKKGHMLDDIWENFKKV
ncbi:reverse transcriptase domain-containing protein [Tanacetum coccineum]